MAPCLPIQERPQQLTSQERALYGWLIALAVKADIGDAQEHALALSHNNKMTLAEAGIAALNQQQVITVRQHSPPLLKNGQKTALSWKNGCL